MLLATACTADPATGSTSNARISAAATSLLLLKFVRWNRRRVFRSGRFRLQMAGLATAFVLTLALLFLSYAYVRHRHNQALYESHGALPIGLDHPEQSTDPLALLGQANRLYWLNNGPKAAPLFAKSRKVIRRQGRCAE